MTTSEEILDTASVLRQALEVWGSEEAADAWLDSEVPALGGGCPRKLLDTSEGRQWVFQVLRKLEYGDFS